MRDADQATITANKRNITFLQTRKKINNTAKQFSVWK